jgi:hypothetical protein
VWGNVLIDIVMKIMRRSLRISLICAIVPLTFGCGRGKIETCRFVKIETPEVEVKIGDVDAEGGEVEMACGEKIVDVPWGEFRKQLKLDPKGYKNNINAFEQQATCTRDEGSKRKEVLCRRTNSNDIVPLTFNFDD